MARLLGRYQIPGCCPGTRAGCDPGPDCSGGGTIGARAAKRAEAAVLAAELPGLIHDMQAGKRADLAARIGISPGDCQHGCNGDCVEYGSDRCTFTCHEAPW